MATTASALPWTECFYPLVLAAFFCLIQSTAASSDKLPSDLAQEVYCSGCEAVTKELYKQLRSKSPDSLEVRVMDALENICDSDNFVGLKLPPSKMVRACKFLLEQHDEDMEQILIRHIRSGKEYEEMELRICDMLSKACFGVRSKAERKKLPKEEFHLEIDKNAKYARSIPESSGKNEL